MRDEQLKTSLKGIDDLKTVPDEHTVAAITDLPGNITKCKRGESINKARDFYLTLLDKFPALIWRSDVNAKCDYFNQTWLEFTGRSMEQEMGDGWAEGVHLEDLAGCLQSFLKAFHSRQPFTLEYRLRRHDEEYRWIIDQGRAFNDLDGQFAGYIGSCVDITERKQAEEARTRLAEMVESSDDAIIGKTLDGIITSWNRGAEKMFGYSAQQSIGKPILMLIPPERANEET
jgi:two-component system, cell cycle sensor histidine kinase and response regulator CckA